MLAISLCSLATSFPYPLPPVTLFRRSVIRTAMTTWRRWQRQALDLRCPGRRAVPALRQALHRCSREMTLLLDPEPSPAMRNTFASEHLPLLVLHALDVNGQHRRP